MNKLIKRDFFPYTLFSFFPLSSFPQKSKICLRKKKYTSSRMYACTDIQQQQKERERREKEKREGGWAGNDVPHRLPPASQNIQRGSRARRPALPWEPAPLSLVRETASSSGIQTSAKRQVRRARHCRAGKLHQINTAENKRQDNFQPASEAEWKRNVRSMKTDERRREESMGLCWVRT